MDPYQVLELDRSATRDDLRRAYRRLSAIHHPDLGGELQTFQKLQRAAEMLELELASLEQQAADPVERQKRPSAWQRYIELTLISISILVILGMIGTSITLWWVANERDRQRNEAIAERVLNDPSIKQEIQPGARLQQKVINEVQDANRVSVRRVVVSEDGVAVPVDPKLLDSGDGEGHAPKWLHDQQE